MKLEKKVQLYDYAYDVLDFASGFTNEEREILKQMHHKKVKLTLELEKPILDDAERKYLSGVIKPFRDRVKCIIKKKSYDYDNREYIVIHAGTHETTPFPYFKNGTMYKNMVINKEYSLEELGL